MATSWPYGNGVEFLASVPNSNVSTDFNASQKFRWRFMKPNCQSILVSPLASNETEYEMPIFLAYSWANVHSSFKLTDYGVSLALSMYFIGAPHALH